MSFNRLNKKLKLHIVVLCVTIPVAPAYSVTPAGVAINNGGDNGSPVYVDGVNQPGDTIVSYNGQIHGASNVVTLSVGQVYELELTPPLSEVKQLFSTKETAYYAYSVKNTGNDKDMIYLSCKILKSSGGSWTVSLVTTPMGTDRVSSPVSIPMDGVCQWYLKVTPPPEAKSKDFCVVKVIAEDSYYHTHTSSDGWPTDSSSDVKTSITTTILTVISKIALMAETTEVKVGAPPISLIAQTQDEFSNPINVGTDTPIYLSSDSPTGEFGSSVEGPWGIDQVTIVKGTHSVDFYYRDSTPGPLRITATGPPEMGWEEAEQKIAVIPSDLAFVVNWPNPFDMTKYQQVYIGPLSKNARVKIYTLDMNLVCTLEERDGVAIWDGRNKDGQKVASGVYIYLVESDKEHKVGKITLIK